MKLSDQQISDFQELVWQHYRDAARHMAWRDNPTPYFVLVSELMLQQTQVGRVIPKFEQFIKQFPDIQSLAKAPLSDVLRSWNGLGYNRRAKFLHQTAEELVLKHDSTLPKTFEELISLPGIGKNTAGAIMAYAFNQPVVFVETNIRTVYFYHFFADQSDIDDKDLRGVVEQTLDHEHPREWYWALMDYGTFLKQTAGNNIAQSRHYAKQSKFEGSRRQLRGKIVRLLLERPRPLEILADQLADDRLRSVLDELQREHFVTNIDGLLKLTDQPKLP